MKEEVFEEILRAISLPVGEPLQDGNTYRVTNKDFHCIKTSHKDELVSFEKFLVLTCNREYVVGGILFYGPVDMQAIVFPEHRGKHFMSEIHKNGVLKQEIYPEQRATVSKKEIKSFDDFCMKHYLLSCIGVKISNLPEIYDYYQNFKTCDRFRGLQEPSKDMFISTYS